MTETPSDGLVVTELRYASARTLRRRETLTTAADRIEAQAARIETLEACLRCDDQSVRTAWAREARLRGALQALCDVVASVGRIDRRMLDALVAARAELDRKSELSRHSPDAPSAERP